MLRASRTAGFSDVMRPGGRKNTARATRTGAPTVERPRPGTRAEKWVSLRLDRGEAMQDRVYGLPGILLSTSFGE